MSDVIYNRLGAYDKERQTARYYTKSLNGVKRCQSATGKGGQSYAEWLKAKETTRRLKKKLIGQA